MTAQFLIDCINSFAQQETNPVLSVIPETGQIQQNCKYPDPVLQFSNAGLRCYYHCHEMAGRSTDEHGHFHIFIKTPDDQWSHIVALSMDDFGQPMQWFTVNHWVSGEQWLLAPGLQQAMHGLQQPDQLSLTECWLMAMLKFYQHEIITLLDQRDIKFNQLVGSGSAQLVMQDKTIVTLSSCSINIINDLQKALEY